MVRGSVFFELFHFSLQTKLMIKFEGQEIIPKWLAKRLFHISEDMNDESLDSNQRFH